MAVLGIICLMLSNILQTSTIFLYLFSTLFTYICTEEHGIKYGILTYAVISLAGFMIVTDKPSIIAYIIVVGYYPVLKHIIDHFNIHKILKWILKNYIEGKSDSAPLFASLKTSQRLDRFTAYKIIVKACRKAKINENIGTHTLRKTFGYHYYKKYKDVAMLQKIFNHSSPNITLRYIGITEDEIYDSYSNFSL